MERCTDWSRKNSNRTMPEIREEMFFFPGGSDAKLLGFLHWPDKPVHTGILYVHPFAEEKNCSHSVAVKAARSFAELGFAVMRFDLSGCGDSEGNMEDFTLADWQNDLKSAIRYLKDKAQVEKVALWGLRSGAGLCLLHTLENDNVPFTLLWQPVIHFKDFMHRFLRQRVGTGLVTHSETVSVKSLVEMLESGRLVEVFGYTVSLALYRSFAETGAAPAKNALKSKTFIASISLMEKAAFKLANFAQNSLNGNTSFVHLVEEPFWDRYWRWNAPKTIQETRRWLQKIK